MYTRKGFTKSKIIPIAMVVLLAIALVMTLVLLLKGRPEDKPVQGNEAAQTDPSGNDATLPEPTDEPSSPTEPTAPSKATDPTKPTNATAPTNTTTPTNATTPAADTFTVTFKDYDGTVLKTQWVEKGKGATAPANPRRENFTFAGWDKSFKKITSNLVVTATYTTTKTVIYAEHISVSKGTGEVTMNIRVLNNPGIMGAVVKISVDDQVFTFQQAAKTGYPGLTLTSPGPKTTASPYTFMLDALELAQEDKQDGTLFTVTFKIKDTTASGKYDVKLSCDNGAIFDEAYKDPKVCLENGSITIQ